ncbi:MAG: hypothetical protein ACOX75_05055 [Lachnospiraceae bacterium]|jgi:hypothetical protein
MDDKNTGGIKISRKTIKKGEGGYSTITVRMTDKLLLQLNEISDESNRSRNEIINMLLESAIKITTIE